MTVSEVREVMRHMWAQNSALLRLLFAQGATLSVLGSVNVQKHVEAHAFEQAYRMFFLAGPPCGAQPRAPRQHDGGPVL